jgi:hypothetical protein
MARRGGDEAARRRIERADTLVPRRRDAMTPRREMPRCRCQARLRAEGKSRMLSAAEGSPSIEALGGQTDSD